MPVRKPEAKVVLDSQGRAEKVSDDGDHESWRCTCGQRHRTYVPRHTQLTTSSTNKIYKQMIDCPLFGKGWLP